MDQVAVTGDGEPRSVAKRFSEFETLREQMIVSDQHRTLCALRSVCSLPSLPVAWAVQVSCGV